MRKFLLVIPAVLVLGALMGCSSGAKFTGYCSLSCQDPSQPPPPPTPEITSIFPDMAVEGGPAFTLTVYVYGFTVSSASPILWNGNALPTTVVSPTELQAQVPAAEIATLHTVSIKVTGAYNTESFTIESNNGFTFSSAGIQANDMVWDPISQQIYLSVPSTNGTNGNTITALDPLNGQLGISQNAGSEPDQLALASGGSYLYAGINGSASVQRFTLPGLGLDINIPLGSNPYSGPYYAMDVEAAPGSPHTIAVVRGSAQLTPSEEGVVIYDDAVARPTTVPGFGSLGGTGTVDSIQWGSNATQIYGEDYETSSFDFYVLSVNSSGVQVTNDYPGVFNMGGAKLHYDATTGYVYSDGGQAVNPSTGALVGKYIDAIGVMTTKGCSMKYGGCVMVPDGTLGFAYFLGQTQAEAGGFDYTLEAFDLKTFAPINFIVIPGVGGVPYRLIRWGTNGLALLTRGNGTSSSTNQPNPSPESDVYLISGTFVTNP